MNYKNQGSWDFTKQPNKWAYLNCKRWSDIPEAVQFSLDRRYPIDPTYAHDPCGHWHMPEIIPGSSESFPVKRLLGWDSVYNDKWAFGWDKDIGQLVKIDLTTLNAIDKVAIDPGFGRQQFDNQSLNGFQYQIIDACDIYIYLIFAGQFTGPNYKIFKIDIQTMVIVQTGEFPHNGLYDVTGGCADMKWIYLTHGGFLTILPTDLESTIYTTNDTIPQVGAVGSAATPRGIKVDPTTDLLYVIPSISSYGVGVFDIEDLNLVAQYGIDTSGMILGGNEWNANLLWVPKFGIGYSSISYHPLVPRCFVWPPTPEHEYALNDSLMGSADWSDCAFYQAGSYFYAPPGPPAHTKNWVNRITFAGPVSGMYILEADNDTTPMPGIELAANKIDCKPVLKSIDEYGGTIGTYLTRLDDSLNVEEFRHLVTGYKVLVEPVDLMTLEPQIWRY
jgi:hypothetical protein